VSIRSNRLLMQSLWILGMAAFVVLSLPQVAQAQTQKSRTATAKAAKKTPAKATKRRASAKVVAARPTAGELAGLRGTDDPLDLKSSVAFVMDQDTHEVLVEKNAQAVLPIASLTKLMTSVVVLDAGLSMDEPLTITSEDIDTEKGSGSRLRPGTTLTRGEMLHLALMSSENRAAHALGRAYPGGMEAFVAAMNAKAQLLGMHDTRYVEPTGLSSRNQSSAKDLAMLVGAASQYPAIRELSTSPEYAVSVGRRTLQYRTTNRLVLNPDWEIDLQKTGYISEAGRCLVMQARLAGRKLVMVFLDSTGKYTRLGDAERVRHWIEANMPGTAADPVTAGATARAGS
jgi:serine-type D-Ala-D-Ala endopeptidase (penicillin-binding protein 7)